LQTAAPKRDHFDGMDDLDKILLTSALTILGGAFVYVFGQIATEFFIKPVQQFWRMCCHIQDRLAFYAPVLRTSGKGVGQSTRGAGGIPALRCPAPRGSFCNRLLHAALSLQDRSRVVGD
jgi:hypothetical protein